MTTPNKKKASNKCNNNVKMFCWNPWVLSNDRINYCRLLDFDILGSTELHNVQNKKAWRGKHWITCADTEQNDDGKCLNV